MSNTRPRKLPHPVYSTATPANAEQTRKDAMEILSTNAERFDKLHSVLSAAHNALESKMETEETSEKHTSNKTISQRAMYDAHYESTISQLAAMRDNAAHIEQEHKNYLKQMQDCGSDAVTPLIQEFNDRLYKQYAPQLVEQFRKLRQETPTGYNAARDVGHAISNLDMHIALSQFQCANLLSSPVERRQVSYLHLKHHYTSLQQTLDEATLLSKNLVRLFIHADGNLRSALNYNAGDEELYTKPVAVSTEVFANGILAKLGKLDSLLDDAQNIGAMNSIYDSTIQAVDDLTQEVKNLWLRAHGTGDGKTGALPALVSTDARPDNPYFTKLVLIFNKDGDLNQHKQKLESFLSTQYALMQAPKSLGR